MKKIKIVGGIKAINELNIEKIISTHCLEDNLYIVPEGEVFSKTEKQTQEQNENLKKQNQELNDKYNKLEKSVIYFIKSLKEENLIELEEED